MISRRKKIKYGKTIRIISIIFVLLCCIFYGNRLIKYYKMYNAKGPSKNENIISIAIPKKSSIANEGPGLYHLGGTYIYKGDVNNNYIEISGLMFRIIKIDYGATVEVVLDEPMNVMRWDKENKLYKDSELNKYLNEIFIKNLDTGYLSKNSVCSDIITDLSLVKNKCNDRSYSTYVKLLDINTFLNTILNNKSFLTSENQISWLSDINKNAIWHTNGYNVSNSPSVNYYNVKPVITLNMDTKLVSGDGTKENPYKIQKEEKPTVGEYVKLGNDLYRILEIDADNYKLELSTFLNRVIPFGPNVEFNVEKTDSLLYYLNISYYNSLPYKNLIVKSKYKYGTYDEEITNKSKIYESFIGLPTILDPKFNDNTMGAYYLANYDENNKIYIYDDTVYMSNPNLAKQVKPVITVNKKIFKNGKGTKTEPYIMEEQK